MHKDMNFQSPPLKKAFSNSSSAHHTATDGEIHQSVRKTAGIERRLNRWKNMKTQRFADNDRPRVGTSRPPSHVRIVCDGSSIRTGEAPDGAAAALLSYTTPSGETKYKLVTEYLPGATNQQAEIVAACIGLEALKKHGLQVTLVSDSQYVIHTMTGENRIHANNEFRRRLKRAAESHNVVWKWVRGHTNWKPHAVCDQAAGHTARQRGNDEAYNVKLLAELKGG